MITMTGIVLSSDLGVHATHCCKRHGCKYGDEKCPVELGHVAGNKSCEYCTSPEGQQAVVAEELLRAMESTLDADRASIPQKTRKLCNLILHPEWY